MFREEPSMNSSSSAHPYQRSLIDRVRKGIHCVPEKVALYRQTHASHLICDIMINEETTYLGKNELLYV